MPRVAIFIATAAILFVSSACQRQVEATLTREATNSESEGTRLNLTLPLKEPQIVVSKQQRRLELYSEGKLLRSYRVGLGFNPRDDKQREGDGCTPEGEFYIFTKNERSAYHLSLGISYPNIEDANRGLKAGLISHAQHRKIIQAIQRKVAPPQNTPLGGQIYIHGHGASSDWTLGCVALENADIAELYGAVTVGTPVIIKP